MRDLGAPELLIIVAIAALLFGPAKTKKVTKQLGRSVAQIRRNLNGEADEVVAAAKKKSSKSNGPRSHQTS